MSTRYVWEKYNAVYMYSQDTITTEDELFDFDGWDQIYIHVFESMPDYDPVTGTWDGASARNIIFAIDDEKFLSSGTIFSLGRYRATTESVLYVLAKENTISHPSETTLKFSKSGTIEKYTGKGKRVKGEVLYDSVASPANNTYPSNGSKGSYWYTKLGSDTIDPSAVSILDTPKAGKEVAVSVAPVVNTYGGTISYAYEYSADGGVSWQAIQTTTATEVSLLVPEDAETLRVRVRASDDMGFTSADYVVSEAVSVKAAGGVTLVIDGIMREADGLYCCVDGIMRPASGTAVLDGIQRDIF